MDGGGLIDYSPWGRKESGMAERLHFLLILSKYLYIYTCVCVYFRIFILPRMSVYMSIPTCFVTHIVVSLDIMYSKYSNLAFIFKRIFLIYGSFSFPHKILNNLV